MIVERVQRNLLVWLLAALIALAWASLWVWGQSPHARYLNHAELAHWGSGAGGAGIVAQAVLYVAAWTLMTIAMMLPTTVPLMQVFWRVTGRRSDRLQLSALLVAGYLLVWMGFGVMAHAFDWGLHHAFEEIDALQDHSWVFGAGPLLLAGLFQFSRLKYRCLDECRTPMGFVTRHWRGGNPQRQSLMLGIDHGVFCVGCCWALMLLMFAVGTGSLGWMLALAAIMAIEKNAAWGRAIGKPLGVVLIVWALMIVADRSFSWQA
jgi:predicted metal-binding membrane protein